MSLERFRRCLLTCALSRFRAATACRGRTRFTWQTNALRTTRSTLNGGRWIGSPTRDDGQTRSTWQNHDALRTKRSTWQTNALKTTRSTLHVIMSSERVEPPSVAAATYGAPRDNAFHLACYYV